MSDDALRFLGLVLDGLTEAKVKSAYARLLKQHRPDQDPEGFKRLRVAYADALAIATSPTGQRVGVSPVPVITAKAATSASEPAPGLTNVGAALAALRLAVEIRIRQRIREAWDALDVAASSLGLETRFNLALSAFDDTQLTLMFDVCDDERLLTHIEAGDEHLPRRALEAWSAQRDVRRIREFVVSLNRARHLQGLPISAVVMVHAAVALAPWEPETARQMASKAFPALPPAGREAFVERCDQEIALGRLVTALPENEKVFWSQCLRGKSAGESWSGSEARKLLTSLLSRCGPKWAGFAVLRSVMAPAEWLTLVAALNQLLR